MKKLVAVVCASIALFALPVMAQSQVDKIETAIKQSLEVRPDVKVESIASSEIPGLYAVQIKDGPMVYASPDGKYFLHGEMYTVQDKAYVNLTEQRASGLRAKEIAAVKTKDMIIFKAKGPTKAVINVFTDIDCGYCRKLHKEIGEINALGIEVRYLAYPRAGIGSESYQKMVTAWCAKDRQGTLTRFKNGEALPINTCSDNPVTSQYQLGERIGVSGTPSLITASGELIPGYMPAKELAERLGLK